MTKNFKGALLGLTLAAGALGACVATAPYAGAPANTTVAFSYSDGYWDRNKQWHGWQNRQDQDRFRQQYPQYHSDRRHDESPGWGWRDDNRYWERR